MTIWAKVLSGLAVMGAGLGLVIKGDYTEVGIALILAGAAEVGASVTVARP